MDQKNITPAQPLIDRLIEETTSREGRINSTGIPKSPSGYELAGKIEAIYPGFGPTFGFENCMDTIQNASGIEFLGGEKIIYGTSFCRPDSKEIIQTIMVTQKVRERLGENIRASYFIDPNSHSLIEYIEAIARDYKLSVEILKQTFDVGLAEGKTDPYEGQSNQFCLPPSYYGLPDVEALQKLGLPDQVKDIWVSKLIEMLEPDYKKPRTFGNWIIEISKEEKTKLLISLGYDPTMINIYSLDEVLISANQISIREIASDVNRIASEYAPTISSIAKLSEASDTEASIESILRHETELPIIADPYEIGMLCLIGIHGEKILINQKGEPIIFIGNKRVNLNIEDLPPKGFDGEPYETYREICRNIRRMTFTEAQSRYPIQPSGVGYYTILGRSIENRATIIADDYEQPRGPYSAMSFTKSTHGSTSIATPKPLLGTEGNFNIPPDLGLLLCMPDESLLKLKRHQERVGEQFSYDEVSFFNGASLEYDPEQKTAKIDIRRIDRYVTLALVNLRNEIAKQPQKSMGASTRRSSPSEVFAHSLYIYNPEALENIANRDDRLAHLPQSTRLSALIVANSQSQGVSSEALLYSLGFTEIEIETLHALISHLDQLPSRKKFLQEKLSQLDLDMAISDSEFLALMDYMTRQNLPITQDELEARASNPLIKRVLKYFEDSYAEELESQCSAQPEYQDLVDSIKKIKDALKKKNSRDPNERMSAMSILSQELQGQLFANELQGKNLEVQANALINRLEYIRTQYQLTALGIQDQPVLNILEDGSLLRNPSKIARLKNESQTKLARSIKHRAKSKFRDVYAAEINPQIEDTLRQYPYLNQDDVTFAINIRKEIEQITRDLQSATTTLEQFGDIYKSRWLEITNYVIANGVAI